MRSPSIAVTALAAMLCGTAAARAAPVVVLDPGHGGTNHGAYGPAPGLWEKRLTLRIAQLTQRELRRRLPGTRIMLTRTADHYLTLQQRVQMANQLGAQAFVSIHLNASETRSQQGFETYVITPAAFDQEARRLAMHRAPAARDDRAADVAAIVADLEQRALHPASARLALAVQTALVRSRGKSRSRGLRQAPFDVLFGLHMPGVLVELGFIDHPREGRELARPAVQRLLAASLADGIRDYLRHARRSAGGH